MQQSITYVIKADTPQEVIGELHAFFKEKALAVKRPKYIKQRDIALQQREAAALQMVVDILECTVVEPKPEEDKPKLVASQ